MTTTKIFPLVYFQVPAVLPLDFFPCFTAFATICRLMPRCAILRAACLEMLSTSVVSSRRPATMASGVNHAGSATTG
ncbi:hypothetical protein [Streptomyces sp. I6]|uniref:hypothetical protein n=1 Tax=Streptomyces sp. I6 TaxID=2483113 RepID=UPI0028809CC4|nr:hypothetical protein [Streptomyces sp. I6]